jgi:hypothetical protein
VVEIKKANQDHAKYPARPQARMDLVIGTFIMSKLVGTNGRPSDTERNGSNHESNAAIKRTDGSAIRMNSFLAP